MKKCSATSSNTESQHTRKEYPAGSNHKSSHCTLDIEKRGKSTENVSEEEQRNYYLSYVKNVKLEIK